MSEIKKLAPHAGFKAEAPPSGRAKRGAALAAAAALKAVDKPLKPMSAEEEWLARLEVGSKLDAVDKGGAWLDAKIIDATGSKVKVHYSSLSQKHDEWMERDLKRMQRHGSRTVAVLEEADDGKVQEPGPKRARRAEGSSPSSASSPLPQLEINPPGHSGEPPDVIGDATNINVGHFRLKIGILDPPRVVIRDMVSMVCGLTDKESAALNIKSLARSIHYERLLKATDSSGTVVLTLEKLHELLHICATFRAGMYRSKVLALLKGGNLVFPRLFAMARAVCLARQKKHPFPPPKQGESLLGRQVLGMYEKDTVNEGWYFGSVKEQDGNKCTIQYYDDKTTVRPSPSCLLPCAVDSAG